MANAIYKKAKESFLKSEIDLIDDVVKLLFVSSDYVVDIDSHQYVSDIGSENIVARSEALDSKTVTLGTFDADNETVEDYGTSGFSYVILYADSGSDSSSELIAYIDTAQGLPVVATSSTVSIAIEWSNDASKIFTL